MIVERTWTDGIAEGKRNKETRDTEELNKYNLESCRTSLTIASRIVGPS